MDHVQAQAPRLRTHYAPVRPARYQHECWTWLRWLCVLWHVLTERKRRVPCLRIPARIVDRPEPCIYSQFYLMALGLSVTWDNPDVAIFRGGVEQSSWGLLPDTEYELRITVRNSSQVKPANGTTVYVRWTDAGAGATVFTPIATLTANVPVYPGTDVVTTTWRTPAAAGHYCIEVELTHPDDALPANNRGWNNTTVLEPASPVDFTLRVHNMALAEPSWSRPTSKALDSSYEAYGLTHAVRRSAPNVVTLAADSYIFNDGGPDHFDPEVAFAPRPAVAPVTIEPPTFAFAPTEAYRDVRVHVDWPDGHRADSINVTARLGGHPLGGMTLQMRPRR